MLKLADEGHDQVAEVGQDLLRVVRSESAKYFDGFDLDFVVGVLHAVEEHEEVFVLGDEWVKV